MLEIRKDPPALPEIDAAALHRMMDEVSVFGGGPGGSMTRLTLSREDGLARDWLAAWFAKQDLRLEVDAIGNMYGNCVWLAFHAYVFWSRIIALRIVRSFLATAMRAIF